MSTHHHHAAVWLDHNEARIFHTSGNTFDETTIHSPKAHTHIHHKAGSDSGQRAAEDQHYYHSIAQALAEAEDVLVLGPSTAKLALIRHLHKHDPKIEAKIIGVETVDHPSDRQLIAYIRQYFKTVDAHHKG